MIQKYMRVELGTGWCTEETVEYYLLENQEQTETTCEDWDEYETMAIDHNEMYGHYCEEDEDGDDTWNEYVINCCESGSIEIVEIDDEDPSAFGDGHLMETLW